MRALLPALLLLAAAPAQVFVVDVVPGPGVHFTSIAAAVAAVPDGAVIDVRPGAYAGFAIQGKSLTIRCQGLVRVSSQQQPTVRIDGLSAGQSVSVRGLDMASFGTEAVFSCANCDGAILLERCSGLFAPTEPGGRLLADSCRQLHLRDCDFSASTPGAVVLDLVATDAAMFVGQLMSGQAPAVRMQGGRLDAVLVGISSLLPTAPVVTMQGATLTLRNSGTVVGAAQAPALIDGTGVVLADPNYLLLSGTAPAFGPGITAAIGAQPWLSWFVGGLGSFVNVGLNAASGLPAILFAGFPGAPFVPAGLGGPVWLDPATVFPVAVGPAPMSGGYTIPNATWVLGVRIGWHGVVQEPSGTLQISNPAVYAHH